MVQNTGPTHQSPAQIDQQKDADRDYLLRKLNSDLFVRTGKQIIDACELHIGFEGWKANLADIWDETLAFARGRRDRVRQVYMVPKNGTVHLIFVSTTNQYDFDLADDLAQFNIRFRREQGVYGDIEASQVPASELEQFIPAEVLNDAPSVEP